MSKVRYKHPLLEQTYRKALETAAAGGRDLFHANGQQRRGSGQACAFWDGFNGVRSAINVPGTQSGVCYQAGKEWRRVCIRTAK